MRLALIAAVVAMAAGRVDAGPSQDFQEGQKSFRERDWSSAIKGLNSLVRPVLKLADQHQLVETYLMLGTARYESGDRETAKLEFREALKLEPSRELVVSGFYSEGAVRVFDETKDELRRQTEADAKQKRDAELKAKIDEYLKNLVVYENHPYYVNFVPFGVPQFQGKRRLEGTILAGSQAITFGTSVSIWIYLATTYGFPRGKVPSATDVTGVNRLQVAEIGAGLAFFALYGVGVYDAITHYQAQTRVKADPSLLPPDLRPSTDEPKPLPKSPKSSFHVIPVLVPNGAGIGLTWEH
jgi:hypothetical protein